VGVKEVFLRFEGWFVEGRVKRARPHGATALFKANKQIVIAVTFLS
jgi:hypothetical protein